MERPICDEAHGLFRASAARFMAAEVAPHAERWRREGFVDREAGLSRKDKTQAYF